MAPRYVEIDSETSSILADSLGTQRRHVRPEFAAHQLAKLKERVLTYTEEQDQVLKKQHRTDERRRSELPDYPVIGAGPFTIADCVDAVLDIQDLAVAFIDGTPDKFGMLLLCRYDLSKENDVHYDVGDKRILTDAVQYLMSLHVRLHGIQYLIWQLSQDCPEYREADEVGCYITKHIAIVDDLLNHVNGGAVDMFESMLMSLFLFQSVKE
ncbi:hypothetical protein CONPUDRAFT_74068 [Coniophora puteana RWD-64-598 SS2]|uniref:Uncharacterized protein n=1 Tax=Coniophora puteana (strain RWD-64-598) TaxID=741705 RepID=A0A5M3ML61_CONPW|nr:uncharacterized protein CONPUDRAFT_74068 [Coniophora puteana RWD-64-598 SS2]EIW79700.1 hypothetical protein CONPUDRAFT_74068 [Coniophora puteana RWD-64-598 SS2]